MGRNDDEYRDENELPPLPVGGEKLPRDEPLKLGPLGPEPLRPGPLTLGRLELELPKLGRLMLGPLGLELPKLGPLRLICGLPMPPGRADELDRKLADGGVNVMPLRIELLPGDEEPPLGKLRDILGALGVLRLMLGPLREMPGELREKLGALGVVADINVVTPRSMAKGLASPWDTNAVTVETQKLAGRPIWDTLFGTWRAASPDDFSIATEPNAPRMYWVSNREFFASTADERNVGTLSSRLSLF